MTGSPPSGGSSPQRRRGRLVTTTSIFAGRLVLIGGWGLLFVSIGVVRQAPSSGHPFVSILVQVIVGLLIALFAAVLIKGGLDRVRNARSDTAPTAQDVLAKDARAPVLYLRSFKQDPAAATVDDMGTRSAEEQMSAVLRRIGPVVAVGDPSDRRVTLGANRIYVRDDEWQGWVKSQMLAAALVIFRASDTDGFWWEVATAALHVPPQKIAFLLPSNPGVYGEFRQRLTRHFPQPLPPSLPTPHWSRSSPEPPALWGLMYLNDAEQPVFRSWLGKGWLGGVKLYTLAGIISLICFLLAFNLQARELEARYLALLRPLLERAGASTLLRPTVFGVVVFPLTLSTFLVLVPFLVAGWIVSRIVRRIRGPLLPGWNESG